MDSKEQLKQQDTDNIWVQRGNHKNERCWRVQKACNRLDILVRHSVIIYLIEQKQKWDWRVSLQLILLQSMKKFTLVVTSITFESKHIKKLLDKVF